MLPESFENHLLKILQLIGHAGFVTLAVSRRWDNAVTRWRLVIRFVIHQRAGISFAVLRRRFHRHLWASLTHVTITDAIKTIKHTHKYFAVHHCHHQCTAPDLNTVQYKPRFLIIFIMGTGIRGLMRGMATLPQGNQELLVVRDKVGRPPGELGHEQVHRMWYFSLQWLDTVGWATGRASGL